MRRWRGRWGWIDGRKLRGNGSARDGLSCCIIMVLSGIRHEGAMIWRHYRGFSEIL